MDLGPRSTYPGKDPLLEQLQTILHYWTETPVNDDEERSSEAPPAGGGGSRPFQDKAFRANISKLEMARTALAVYTSNTDGTYRPILQSLFSFLFAFCDDLLETCQEQQMALHYHHDQRSTTTEEDKYKALYELNYNQDHHKTSENEIVSKAYEKVRTVEEQMLRLVEDASAQRDRYKAILESKNSYVTKLEGLLAHQIELTRTVLKTNTAGGHSNKGGRGGAVAASSSASAAAATTGRVDYVASLAEQMTHLAAAGNPTTATTTSSSTTGGQSASVVQSLQGAVQQAANREYEAMQSSSGNHPSITGGTSSGDKAEKDAAYVLQLIHKAEREKLLDETEDELKKIKLENKTLLSQMDKIKELNSLYARQCLELSLRLQVINDHNLLLYSDSELYKKDVWNETEKNRKLYRELMTARDFILLQLEWRRKESEEVKERFNRVLAAVQYYIRENKGPVGGSTTKGKKDGLDWKALPDTLKDIFYADLPNDFDDIDPQSVPLHPKTIFEKVLRIATHQDGVPSLEGTAGAYRNNNNNNSNGSIQDAILSRLNASNLTVKDLDLPRSSQETGLNRNVVNNRRRKTSLFHDPLYMNRREEEEGEGVKHHDNDSLKEYIKRERIRKIKEKHYFSLLNSAMEYNYVLPYRCTATVDGVTEGSLSSSSSAVHTRLTLQYVPQHLLYFTAPSNPAAPPPPLSLLYYSLDPLLVESVLHQLLSQRLKALSLYYQVVEMREKERQLQQAEEEEEKEKAVVGRPGGLAEPSLGAKTPTLDDEDTAAAAPSSPYPYTTLLSTTAPLPLDYFIVLFVKIMFFNEEKDLLPLLPLKLRKEIEQLLTPPKDGKQTNNPTTNANTAAATGVGKRSAVHRKPPPSTKAAAPAAPSSSVVLHPSLPSYVYGHLELLLSIVSFDLEELSTSLQLQQQSTKNKETAPLHASKYSHLMNDTTSRHGGNAQRVSSFQEVLRQRLRLRYSGLQLTYSIEESISHNHHSRIGIASYLYYHLSHKRIAEVVLLVLEKERENFIALCNYCELCIYKGHERELARIRRKYNPVKKVRTPPPLSPPPSLTPPPTEEEKLVDGKKGRKKKKAATAAAATSTSNKGPKPKKKKGKKSSPVPSETDGVRAEDSTTAEEEKEKERASDGNVSTTHPSKEGEKEEDSDDHQSSSEEEEDEEDIHRSIVDESQSDVESDDDEEEEDQDGHTKATQKKRPLKGMIPSYYLLQVLLLLFPSYSLPQLHSLTQKAMQEAGAFPAPQRSVAEPSFGEGEEVDEDNNDDVEKEGKQSPSDASIKTEKHEINETLNDSESSSSTKKKIASVVPPTSKTVENINYFVLLPSRQLPSHQHSSQDPPVEQDNNKADKKKQQQNPTATAKKDDDDRTYFIHLLHHQTDFSLLFYKFIVDDVLESYQMIEDSLRATLDRSTAVDTGREEGGGGEDGDAPPLNNSNNNNNNGATSSSVAPASSPSDLTLPLLLSQGLRQIYLLYRSAWQPAFQTAMHYYYEVHLPQHRNTNNNNNTNTNNNNNIGVQIDEIVLYLRENVIFLKGMLCEEEHQLQNNNNNNKKKTKQSSRSTTTTTTTSANEVTLYQFINGYHSSSTNDSPLPPSTDAAATSLMITPLEKLFNTLQKNYLDYAQSVSPSFYRYVTTVKLSPLCLKAFLMRRCNRTFNNNNNNNNNKDISVMIRKRSWCVASQNFYYCVRHFTEQKEKERIKFGKDRLYNNNNNNNNKLQPVSSPSKQDKTNEGRDDDEEEGKEITIIITITIIIASMREWDFIHFRWAIAIKLENGLE